MFGNISDKSDKIKREASSLDKYLFKNLRILNTSLSIFKKEMMLEISLQSVGEIKSKILFLDKRK